MQITQTKLDLPIKKRCAECGRPIKEGTHGKVCKCKREKIVLPLFIRTFERKDWPLIEDFIKEMRSE